MLKIFPGLTSSLWHKYQNVPLQTHIKETKKVAAIFANIPNANN